MKIIDPNVIHKPATALFNTLDKEIKQISFIGKGEGSVVYKIETLEKKYCLKTALFPERTKKILNEAKIRQDFIDKGLTFVPSPIFTDQKYFKNGAVIYDYIEGTPTIFDSKNTLSQLARYLAEIHKLDFKIIPKGIDQIWNNYFFLEQTIKSIQSRYAHLLNENINQAFTNVLNEYKPQITKNLELFPFGISSILHGDVGSNCITDTEGKLWLIDWENSEYGDIVEEVCFFVMNNDIEEDLQDFFYQEYQKHFQPSNKLNFKKMGEFYMKTVPIFNLCWGIDQLNKNLIYKIEPERKLKDIMSSARNWNLFFSESTSLMIVQGVKEMTAKLSKDL
ncbi:MAG: aminoglycoside phosphotransferase family protein [Candidatus Heimdallarchaeota archaeon]